MSEVQRTARAVERGDEAYRAIEAWRGASHHGLCYFVKLDAPGGAPDPDDAGDRRASLAPSERLEELSERRLDELLEGAVPLTVTERRFEAPDGRLWLAQSVGPVWAESGGVAEGTTAVLFTSLQGPWVRVEAEGGHVGRTGTGELVAAWRRAREVAEPDREGLESEA